MVVSRQEFQIEQQRLDDLSRRFDLLPQDLGQDPEPNQPQESKLFVRLDEDLVPGDEVEGELGTIDAMGCFCPQRVVTVSDTYCLTLACMGEIIPVCRSGCMFRTYIPWNIGNVCAQVVCPDCDPEDEECEEPICPKPNPGETHECDVPPSAKGMARITNNPCCDPKVEFRNTTGQLIEFCDNIELSLVRVKPEPDTLSTDTDPSNCPDGNCGPSMTNCKWTCYWEIAKEGADQSCECYLDRIFVCSDDKIQCQIDPNPVRVCRAIRPDNPAHNGRDVIIHRIRLTCCEGGERVTETRVVELLCSQLECIQIPGFASCPNPITVGNNAKCCEPCVCENKDLHFCLFGEPFVNVGEKEISKCCEACPGGAMIYVESIDFRFDDCCNTVTHLVEIQYECIEESPDPGTGETEPDDDDSNIVTEMHELTFPCDSFGASIISFDDGPPGPSGNDVNNPCDFQIEFSNVPIPCEKCLPSVFACIVGSSPVILSSEGDAHTFDLSECCPECEDEASMTVVLEELIECPLAGRACLSVSSNCNGLETDFPSPIFISRLCDGPLPDCIQIPFETGTGSVVCKATLMLGSESSCIKDCSADSNNICKCLDGTGNGQLTLFPRDILPGVIQADIPLGATGAVQFEGGFSSQVINLGCDDCTAEDNVLVKVGKDCKCYVECCKKKDDDDIDPPAGPAEPCQCENPVFISCDERISVDVKMLELSPNDDGSVTAIHTVCFVCNEDGELSQNSSDGSNEYNISLNCAGTDCARIGLDFPTGSECEDLTSIMVGNSQGCCGVERCESDLPDQASTDSALSNAFVSGLVNVGDAIPFGGTVELNYTVTPQFNAGHSGEVSIGLPCSNFADTRFRADFFSPITGGDLEAQGTVLASYPQFQYLTNAIVTVSGTVTLVGPGQTYHCVATITYDFEYLDSDGNTNSISHQATSDHTREFDEICAALGVGSTNFFFDFSGDPVFTIDTDLSIG